MDVIVNCGDFLVYADKYVQGGHDSYLDCKHLNPKLDWTSK